MNPDVSVPTRIGKRRMQFDGKQLLTDSISILRKFNPYACVAGIMSTILFVSPLLEMHPLLSLALGAAVYAGVTLVWPQKYTTSDDPGEPLGPEKEAYLQAQQATTRVTVFASQIDKAGVQREVQEIGLSFAKMLDVMKKDGNYVAVPTYNAELIAPFEAVLAEYVELGKRDIDLATHQLATFEETVVPQVREFTKSYYQHYHDDRVRDLAARIEIFWDTVDSQREEDEDLDDLTVDDELGNGAGGLSFDQEFGQEKEERG